MREKNQYHMGQTVYAVVNYKVEPVVIEGMKYDDKEKIHVEYWINNWWFPENGIGATKEELIEKLTV